MPKSTILVLLLSFIAASCGQELRSRQSKEVEIPITEAEANAIKSFQSFTCESIDGQDCPAGVGRILVLNYKSRTKSRLCSGKARFYGKACTPWASLPSRDSFRKSGRNGRGINEP